MLLVGLAAVGALTLVLAARLLVVRRETFLLAERARGASVASVAVRALVESVPLVALATAVGAAVAWLIAPDPRGNWTVAAMIVLVAATAPAISAAVVVAGAWTGRRLPANRADRERVLGRRRARRLTAELALVAIAAAALVSARGRGLVQTATGGVDLLLAATPVLLACAATVLVARVLPPTLRALSGLASRRRGLVPVVATARASRTSGTRVPLLTLTIAIALVVFCGTTAVTVTAGQRTAADIVVGAQVRVDGTLDPEVVAFLRTRPGRDRRGRRHHARRAHLRPVQRGQDTAAAGRLGRARGDPRRPRPSGGPGPGRARLAAGRRRPGAHLPVAAEHGGARRRPPSWATRASST